MYLLFEILYWVFLAATIITPLVISYRFIKNKTFSLKALLKLVLATFSCFVLSLICFMLALWLIPESIDQERAKKQEEKLIQMSKDTLKQEEANAEQLAILRKENLLKKEIPLIQEKLIVTIFTNDTTWDKDGNTQVKVVVHNPTNRKIKSLDLRVNSYDNAENRMEYEEFVFTNIVPNGTIIGEMWIVKRKALKRFDYVLTVKGIE